MIPCRAGAPLKIGARDAQLFHHGVQRGPRHSQAIGGGADHAAGFPEDPQDMIALHFFKRRVAAVFRSVRPQFR